MSDSRENDVEHSFSVAILCWFIISTFDLELDLGLVLKYALAHDFVERYAGDTNAFASSKQRAEKVLREQEALIKLSDEFAGFPDLVHVMNGYETKTNPEALFVWTVDKMQALILGDIDSWRPYKELSISYEAFCARYAELLEQASPYCEEIFNSLIKYCQSTYYDQPSPSQQG